MPKITNEIEEIKEKTVKTTKKTATKSAAKTTTTKKATTKKNATTKKATTTSKKAASKKTTAKKTTNVKAKAKTSAKSSTTKKTAEKNVVVEYYDLPQKYNQTVVKVLAQTPKTLFIYWEISDDDISNYKEKYGENFFETTRPVLIVHNDTLNYSFEVEINDFANSWYLHVADSKSDYRIELGRRPYVKNEVINNDYIYITSSNEIETPNDHILFNNEQKMVYFRNVKTNQETSKPVTSLSFIRNMGRIYDVYDLYKEFYKNEDEFKQITNPSSSR